MLVEPEAILMDHAPIDDGDVGEHSRATADELASAGLADEDDDDEVPLVVKRRRPSVVQSAGGDGGAPPPVVAGSVPCPPPAAPKKRKFGVIVRPPTAPQVFVLFFSCTFICVLAPEM